MALTVRLHFTGLCAFVPHKAITEDENEATLILVNARHSSCESHETLLFAEPDFYPDANNRESRLSFKFMREYGVDVLVKACFLGGEALVLVGRKEDGSRVELLRNALRFAHGTRVPPCPSVQSQFDFSWVVPNPGTLDRTLLTAMDRSDLIGVRMTLTEGSLRCGGFRQIRQGLVRWHFGTGESIALAEEVRYDLTINDSTIKGVTLETIPFQNQPPQKDIRLMPKGDLIEAWIVNMPIPSLVAAEPLRPLDPDLHYSEYYRLCTGSTPTTVPIPDLISFCPPFSNASNPKCPPTTFSPLTAEIAMEEPQLPLAAKPKHRH